MGQGKAPAFLVILLAASGLAAAAPALPGDLDADLLPRAGGPSAPASASSLPDASPVAGSAEPVQRNGLDVLASLAGALGAAAGALAGVAGGAVALGGAVLGGLAALLGAIGAALGAGLGTLAGALLAGVATLAGGLGALAGRAAERPEALATPLAGTAAAWALGPLKAVAAPLFSRLAKHELLQHEARQRIFEFVRERPGAHLSQVQAHMGLGWGATVYHLRRLREAQLLTARTVGNQLCHFVNGDTRTAQEQQVLAATKTAKAQAIVDYIKLRGPSAQSEVARELGMSSALVSWHAKRLEDLGVLERARAGRTCLLALRGAAPAPTATARVVRTAAAPSPMPAPAPAPTAAA